MTSSEGDQFESGCRTVDHRVDDRYTRRFHPLTQNFVVLKSGKSELHYSTEILHTDRQRLGEVVAQISILADDRFIRIVGETDRGLRMMRSVTEVDGGLVVGRGGSSGRLGGRECVDGGI